MDLNILNWIYPPRCVFCHNIIPLNKYTKFDVCDKCIDHIPFMNKPNCIKCGKSIEAENQLCKDCLKDKHFYKKGWIALKYDDMIKESIYRFKYDNCALYSKTFAQIMYQTIETKDIINYKFDIITYVPIHKNKLKSRGYNQAKLLADELSIKLNIPSKNLIVRTKDTKPQSNLSPKERFNNLKGAFKLSSNQKLINKNILIIDDIYTTGSTINACANTLIDIGYGVDIYYYILAGTSH